MFTFIAFALTIAGSINWLMIGLLQYDFIAGIFGWQSSLMSRLVYIAFGIGAIYLVLRVLINKGSVKVWEKKGSKEEKVVESKQMKEVKKPRKNWKFWKKKTPEKVEKTIVSKEIDQESPDEPFSTQTKPEQNNLFDEPHN